MSEITRRQALTAFGVGAAALAGAGGTARAAAASTPSPSDLRTALGSEVLFPGDPGYAAESAAFNTLIQQSPLAIVLPQTPRDVATAIRIGAGELGWPVAIQATGHGISVPADGALLINMRKMNGVTVNRSRRTAQIGGGARWSDVLTASAPLGLLPPVGSTSDVGATGYISGGGVPVIGRTYGFAADQVRSIALVTPDGQMRFLSPRSNPDLFWAVRGGESNFGAVTSFEISLVPTATVYAGALLFPAAAANAAFQSYATWTSTVSDRMTSVASFERIPNVPQALRIEVVYLGTPAEGDAELASLRALGPVSDSVAEVPIAQMDTIFGVPKNPSASLSASGLIESLDSASTATVLNAIGFDVTLPAGIIEVRQLGGAFARHPKVPNAIGNRRAGFLMYLNNPVIQAGLANQIEQSQQQTLARLAPVLTGRTIPTFLGPLDTSTAAVESAYAPGDWNRLVRLKHVYDPHNLFRINHNIW